MTTTGNKAISRYRTRQKRRGLLRVEVQVRREDAPLVRAVARALIDPERRQKLRRSLTEELLDRKSKGLKALLAEAPLDGIDLRRSRSIGRTIRL